MSDTKKTVLIVAACVVSLGLLLGCVGFFLLGGLQNSESYVSHTERFAADLSEIRTQLGSADIRLYPVTGTEVVVTWQDTDSRRFLVQTTGDRLDIGLETDARPWYQHVGIWLGTQPFDLEIGIPAGFSGALALHAAAGDIQAADLTLAAPMAVEITSGSIRLEAVSCAGDLTVAATSGDMDLTDIHTPGTLTLQGTSAQIRGQNLSCADLRGQTTSGDLVLRNLRAQRVDACSTSGRLALEGLDAGESIRLEAVSGDIDCSVPDAISAYSITSRTISGDCDLPDSADYGPKRLDVRTSSGSIGFRFAQ